MSKTLKFFIIAILLLGIASLTLGIMLFGQRETLKGRTQVLEQAHLSVAEKLKFTDIRLSQLKDYAAMREPLAKLSNHADLTYIELQDTKQDLARTRVELDETRNQLAITRQDLETARGRITSLEGQLAQKQEELTTALARIDRLEEEKNGLLAQIQTHEQTIAELNEAMADLNDELRAVKDDNVKLIAQIGGQSGSGETPLGLAGEIVTVKPEWNFVVINKGFSDKLSNGTRMLVHRGEQLLGMVTVSSVEETMSVADIMRDWTLGEFRPGDKVLFEVIAAEPGASTAQPDRT